MPPDLPSCLWLCRSVPHLIISYSWQLEILVTALFYALKPRLRNQTLLLKCNRIWCVLTEIVCKSTMLTPVHVRSIYFVKAYFKNTCTFSIYFHQVFIKKQHSVRNFDSTHHWVSDFEKCSKKYTICTRDIGLVLELHSPS